MNLDQNPPRFDEGVDRAGPISVAVAVEKGRSPVADPEGAEIKALLKRL